MNLKNFKITNKGLYWGLIVTFALLYLCVGFVSTLHSITFFNLANTVGLAVLLGITYEIGQASVLFSILMTKNKDKFLPWALMFLLTALQVTANVYASFKFMANSGSDDWQYWQKSILIGVQAENAEMYQVIISWIAGALLPIVALGMTALVAQNIKLMSEEDEKKSLPEPEEIPEIEKPLEPTIVNEYEKDYLDEEIALIEDAKPKVIDEPIPEKEIETKLVEQIEPEKPVTAKKRGRPPKKDVVVEPKKEKELLPKEDVRVPKKRRTVDPLKKKTKIKNLDLKELHKPSVGDKILELIEKQEKDQIKESIITDNKDVLESPGVSLVPPEIEDAIPYVEGGVEVLDAKAVPKPENEKKKLKSEKFGIPISPKERKNFDRI